MADAAERCLSSITDACTRLDKGKRGEVTLSAYLLAVHRSGVCLSGGERERARAIAEAGGNAVSLPPAWNVEAVRRAGAEGGDPHGSVRYVAMDMRIRAACTRLLGCRVDSNKTRLGGASKGGLEEHGWSVAMVQQEAEQQERIAEQRRARASRAGAGAKGQLAGTVGSKGSGGGGVADGSGSVKAKGYFGELGGGSEAASEVITALIAEIAVLRDDLGREAAVKGRGGRGRAEEAGRRAMDMEVLLAKQWLEDAEARHEAAGRREAEVGERERAVGEGEEKLARSKKEVSEALWAVEERERELRRREEEWEASNPTEAGLSRELLGVEKDKAGLEERLVAKEREVFELRDQVTRAAREAETERQRAGLMEAMTREQREACESEAAMKSALGVVCGERDAYYRALFAIEAACNDVEDDYMVHVDVIRQCLAV